MRAITMTTAIGRGLLAVLGLLVAAAPAAHAQIKPAMVRSVDEPARVPYTTQMQPTCPFTNQCVATFPTVPVGKRLRVTTVYATFFSANFSGILVVHVGASKEIAAIFPVPPLAAAYYGSVGSTTQSVDLVYEAGEAPMLEYGTSAANTIFADSRHRLGLSGYLVDVAP